MEKEKFRKLFPHLAAEMESDISQVSQEKIEYKEDQRKWANYNPTIIDFIRRCDNKEQAEKIINYMECRAEISSIEAQNLRKKLEDGLSSFGKKKEKGYYHKNI